MKVEVEVRSTRASVVSVVRSVGAVVVMLLLAIAFGAQTVQADPPPTWRVGTLVHVEEEEILPGVSVFRHVVEYPGAPLSVDCTDLLDTDWCMKVDCAIGPSSTYGPLTAPLLYVCLAYEVESGVVTRITNIDSDACK